MRMPPSPNTLPSTQIGGEENGIAVDAPSGSEVSRGASVRYTASGVSDIQVLVNRRTAAEKSAAPAAIAAQLTAPAERPVSTLNGDSVADGPRISTSARSTPTW